jgi:hypothetical protein
LVYFFPFWYVWTKKNLATPNLWIVRSDQCWRKGRNFAIGANILNKLAHK